MMTNNMQYLLAYLLTHADFLKRVISDDRSINTLFYLSRRDQLNLKNFLLSDGKRVLATAFLMEEKRWRDMLAVLKYIPRLINPAQLKWDWQCYLRTLDAKIIPKTPLDESIYFLNYLLNIYYLYEVLYGLIQYELSMNIVLAHEFIERYEDCNNHLSHHCVDSLSDRIALNASLFKRSFSFSVSKVIAYFKRVDQIDLNEINIVFQPEEIFFYKSKKTMLAKAIILIDISSIIINYLLSSKIFYGCLACIMKTLQLDCNEHKKIINKIIMHDLISLEQAN